MDGDLGRGFADAMGGRGFGHRSAVDPGAADQIAGAGGHCLQHGIEVAPGQGIGIVVISSELPEMLGLCDRVLVVREGRVAGELGADEMSEEAVMRLASGIGKTGQAKNGQARHAA